MLQRLAAGKSIFNIVPPLDLIAFIGFPAQKNDAALTQGRKIDKTLCVVF